MSSPPRARHYWDCCGCKCNDESLAETEIWMLEQMFEQLEASRPTPTGHLDRAEVEEMATKLGKDASNPNVVWAIKMLDGDDGHAPDGKVPATAARTRLESHCDWRYDTFGDIGTSFREFEWKTPFFYGRVVPKTPNAPYNLTGLSGPAGAIRPLPDVLSGPSRGV
jgi:hypothetical protein